MGTSISHSSPRSSQWKPVHVCYINDKIPEDRVIQEIWRAADNPNESVQWSTEMKSEIIYNCFETIKSSSNIEEALNKFNTEIQVTKKNSIVAEFAKRAIPSAFQNENPTVGWINRFFSEVTNYIVSRDTSGFVGENYRNKTVKDLEGFKQRLNTSLNQMLGSEKTNIISSKEWDKFIDKTVSKLKNKIK